MKETAVWTVCVRDNKDSEDKLFLPLPCPFDLLKTEVWFKYSQVIES